MCSMRVYVHEHIDKNSTDMSLNDVVPTIICLYQNEANEYHL